MNNQMIKMSVVIPTHGRVDLLKETLKSLYNQSSKKFEVIITDDSPLVEQREKISELVTLYKSKGMIIRYIFSKPNILQAPNTNQGLKIATGSYIRILHSDDLISPNCIEKEIEVFEKNPKIDFLYHWSIPFTDNLNFETKVVNLNFIDSRVWLDNPIFTHTVLPSCLCFRSSLLSEIKGMDESYKFLCDWQLFFDFLLSSYKQGKSICFYNTGYVGWRVHEQSVTSTLYIDHFLEHERFIRKISQVYNEMKIVSKNKLRQNIYDATKYRYERLYTDLKKYTKKGFKFKSHLLYLRFLLSRKYGIIHCFLKIIFMPAVFIRIIAHFIYKAIIDPNHYIEKIEKKLVRFWK